MRTEILIKKTATAEGGEKYLAMAEAGPIKSPVTLNEAPNGKLIASIDGEDIGFVKEMKKPDLPNIYEIFISGAENGVFKAEMTFDETATTSPSDYADEIDRIVSEGIMNEEDVKDRIKVMEDNLVHPAVIKSVLSAYKKFDMPHKPSAIYQNARGKGEETIMNQALIADQTWSALIFAGDKSTGKNVCAETIAYCTGKPYYRVAFEKDMLLEDIFGSKTTDNSAADALELDLAKAKLKVELAGDTSEEALEKAAQFELLKAQSACIRLVQSTSDIIKWAKEGGVMMYDEVNMANANTLQAVMNSVADNEKVLLVPGVGAIQLNPACTLLAGMNPGYAGTYDLNEATKSRCGFINFEYPESIKAQLKANFSFGELPTKYINACDDLYKDFKGAVSQGRISNGCLNIRGFVSALKAVARFPEATKLTTQIEIFVIGGCSQDDQTVLKSMLFNKVDM